MDANRLRALLREFAQSGGADPVGDRILRLVDDQRLAWGKRGAPDALLDHLPDAAGGAPLQWLADNAEAVLGAFYRTHPLTRSGFDTQVKALAAQHGYDAFAAPAGQYPPFTLFVEHGTVVAEPRQSARHRYGTFCELPGPLRQQEAARRVEAWLGSGEAYDDYLSRNVCRYNC